MSERHHARGNRYRRPAGRPAGSKSMVEWITRWPAKLIAANRSEAEFRSVAFAEDYSTGVAQTGDDKVVTGRDMISEKNRTVSGTDSIGVGEILYGNWQPVEHAPLLWRYFVKPVGLGAGAVFIYGDKGREIGIACDDTIKMGFHDVTHTACSRS